MRTFDLDVHKINNFFPELIHQLASFLSIHIPEIGNEKTWWQDLVLDQLSYNQASRVQEEDSGNFSILDLASLLKILDSNWYELQLKNEFNKEDRNYIKEMQTIRSRWAHQPAGGFSSDDRYRDLDTMQRFCKIIQAEEFLTNALYDAKTQLIEAIHTKDIEVHETPIENTPEPKIDVTERFSLGQMVFIISDPSSLGAIININDTPPETRYTVFFNNQSHTYYASQLQPVVSEDSKFQNIELEKFLCFLTSQQIIFPALSTLYSLNAARINFIPYQLRPVLKFIQSDRPRLLIADGVGVGKTIEAGLILRELQARREVNSVLVICPKPLVVEKKWENELKRFDEKFMPLDGKLLKYCISETNNDGQWPERYQKSILPYSLLDESLLFGTSKGRKKKNGLIDLYPPPRFDLIIVDEAHHIRNTDTYAHKAVRFLCDNAEAVLFLTATPIQLGNQDLFVLLNTLRPDLVIDKQSFDHMVEPNLFITEAAMHVRNETKEWKKQAAKSLNKAVNTPWGSSIMKEKPELLECIDILKQNQVTNEERIKLLTKVENLNTFSSLINRTRRRDIGDFTIRKPQTIQVNFTSAQKTIHDELLDIQAEIMGRLHGNVNIKFLLSMIRRQVSSSLFGLAPYLEDILLRRMPELEELDQSFFDEQNAGWFVILDTKIKLMLEKVKDLPPHDPKLERLVEVIKLKQTFPNNKIMLFSTFRHTLRYLYKKLYPYGFRVGLIHGDVKDEDRMQLRKRFMLPKDNPDAIDLMLFSEVGSEGLDYQFCDCMVNYDLPWNPMRIEQRIGRIDRNGQKSERVTIYNFITPGTIDADIYERCLVRIGVFNSSLGVSEEIMGEITKGINDIGQDFTLTSEMRQEKLQQLADNKIRLVQEQEALEQKQLQLFGIQLPQDQMKKEIEDASSILLTPKSIQRLVKEYLQSRCSIDQEYILGDKALRTLRLNQESREKLRLDFRNLPRQNNQMYRIWETWLKGDTPHASITFESDCASDNPDAMLLMPIHPLVKQAANFFSETKKNTTAMKVVSDTYKPGKYSFAIYRWHYLGIKEDLVFHPIVSDSILNDSLFALCEQAEPLSEFAVDVDTLDTEALDAQHYKDWTQARDAHSKRSKSLIEYRKESLITSHKARIALLENQLASAGDEKIQRMRQTQIQNAETDYKNHYEELESAIRKADITADLLSYGTLIIEGKIHDIG